jgi:hypothetical protein
MTIMMINSGIPMLPIFFLLSRTPNRFNKTVFYVDIISEIIVLTLRLDLVNYPGLVISVPISWSSLPCEYRYCWRRNSMTPGRIEIIIIVRMTKVK